jgi:hypothetical protein
MNESYFEESDSSSNSREVGVSANPAPPGNRMAIEYSPTSNAALSSPNRLPTPVSGDVSDSKNASTEATFTRSETMRAETGSFELNSKEQEALCHFFNLSSPSMVDMFFLLSVRNLGRRDAVKIYSGRRGHCPTARVKASQWLRAERTRKSRCGRGESSAPGPRRPAPAPSNCRRS